MSVTTDPERAPGAAPPPARRRRSVAAAVLVTFGSAAAVVAIAYLALQTARGQDLDDRAMTIFSVNGDPTAARPLLGLLGDVSIGSAALALVVFVGLALLRRGFALAVGAAALVVGANLTTQALKHLVLTRPDLDHGTLNSLPSGHTTLVFSLVLAALLVAPVRVRLPVVLVGAAIGTLTGAATVVAGWHRPSDVVTSMLVTLAWGAATAAVLAAFTAPPGPVGSDDRRGVLTHAVAGLLGSAVAAVLLVTWGVGPGTGPGEMVAAVLSLGSVALASAVAVAGYAGLLARTVD